VITETWRSERLYDPNAPQKRYVRTTRSGKFAWIVVMDAERRFDALRGMADPDDVPEAVRQAAQEVRSAGTWPPYVEWPL
jgi:hypothetical protein